MKSISKSTSPIASGLSGAPTNDAVWSSRCWFWRDKFEGSKKPRPKNQRGIQPLILSGFGVSFRIEGGSLKIRNGFTHHPQKQETYRFFKGDLDLPERIILLDCTGNISFDVMAWIAEQGVSLIKLNWQGDIVCLSSPNGFSANPFRLNWQRETRFDPRRRTAFCAQLITRKIENSILTLEKSLRRTPHWERAMRTAYAALTRLDEGRARDVIEIRGIEGTAAAAYFRAWSGTHIHWRKRSRRPIPPSWRTLGVRSSGFYASGNQNAGHPANAILNYAYTVLQTDVQIWAIAQGFDPAAGIMHESRPQASAFVFDMMEPLRSMVDEKVLTFVKTTEFDPADFMIREDGVCRLNPDLARRIVQLTFTGGRLPDAAGLSDLTLQG